METEKWRYEEDMNVMGGTEDVMKNTNTILKISQIFPKKPKKKKKSSKSTISRHSSALRMRFTSSFG